MRSFIGLANERLRSATRSLKSGFTNRILVRALLVPMVLSSSLSKAYAQEGTDPAEILNQICEFILGDFGKSLAILGIVAIGVSWMFGRASLALVAGVIGGIVIMFGASFFGAALTG